MELLRRLAVEKPLYYLFGTLILILWGFEKWVFSISSWLPLLVSVWATIQYASHQHRIKVEDLNRKWKRVVLESSAVTPVEQCEWLNKLVTEIWPNFLSPMLSTRFSSIVEKRLKRRIPTFIEKIEIQEFSLGSSPPSLALHGIRWLTIGDQRMMHLGVEWDTCLFIVLLAKLGKPLNGTARIVINRIYMKGDLQVMPILEGKAMLYSFLTSPLVKMDATFGSGSSQLLPATELPGLSSWLGKMLSDTLAKTMVEPHRSCCPLVVVARTSRGRKAVAGALHVTVVGAHQISPGAAGFSGSPTTTNRRLHTFVEVQLEQLSRRTDVQQGSSPTWDSTFNMVLHNNSGILKFRLYQCNPGSVRYDFLASCEIKVRYCEDDSTIFWAVGRPNSKAIATQVGIGGQEEVEMIVPFEGTNSGEIRVRLVLQEWQFSDGLQSFPLSSKQIVDESPTNISATTGRKFYVTVGEAKNLARKDKSGKINPYVKLHYGKTTLRTETMWNGTTPTWNKTFEFEEVGGGEYLILRCYSEDTFGDEHIGSARVNLERIIEGSLKDEWIPLEKVNSGDIRLLIEVVQMDKNQRSRGTNDGWIELVLVEAKDLVAADLRGTSDPYVKVQYGNLKKRTKVVYRTLNPHWNQTLEFVDDGSPLTLYVKDHNDILAASSIGECEIEYQRLPLNQTYDKWIPLQGVTKGEVHVLITRKSPDKLHKPNSFDSDSSLDKARNITYQIKQLLMKLQSSAGEGDLDNVLKTVNEIETFEEIREEYIIQLETEKALLLNKVSVLDEEISNSPSSSVQSPATLTHYTKSLP